MARWSSFKPGSIPGIPTQSQLTEGVSMGAELKALYSMLERAGREIDRLNADLSAERRKVDALLTGHGISCEWPDCLGCN